MNSAWIWNRRTFIRKIRTNLPRHNTSQFAKQIWSASCNHFSLPFGVDSTRRKRFFASLIKRNCWCGWKRLSSVFNFQLFFSSNFLITEVLKQYGSRLSDYERQEIEKYPEIWYLGLESCKINAKPGTPLNCGYDDENGSYNKVRLVKMKHSRRPWTWSGRNGFRVNLCSESDMTSKRTDPQQCACSSVF